jgi:CRP-like cAMP-binding protein
MSREVKLQSLASIGISSNLLSAAKEADRTDGLELLARLVTLIESQTFEVGPLYKEGDMADTFYIVRAGEVSLQFDNDGGGGGGGEDECVVSKGGCFGEAALILSSEEKYTETCHVIKKSELFVLKREDLVLLNFGDLLISDEMKARMELSRKSSTTSPPTEEEEAAFNSQLDSMRDALPDLNKNPNEDDDDDEDENMSRRATEAFQVCRTVLTAPIGLEDLVMERTIGCGFFGRVKLATHKASGTVCAVKILQKDTIVEMKQTRNISREKDIVASLTHPNVLRLYGTFQDQDCLYMMLELVNGGELYRLMHGDGSEENVLPFKDARFYVAQVLNVYEYIHARNIIYRDLKPENLLISSCGYLKVIDWGFAKEITDNITYTMCGTPEYLAPEIVNCSGHGRAADLWSLGVNLYEMVVGYSPFVGDDVNDHLDICRRITCGVLEWPPDRPVDPRFVDMITQLLVQDPTARLGCMAEGCKAVEKHVVYEGDDELPAFDWEAMRRFEMEAPWIPDIPDGAKDVSNFDDIYDDEEEEIIPYDGDVVFDF